MHLKIAEHCDIVDVLKLHYKYQIDSINEEDKKDGFVTTAFTAEQLSDLIDKEQGLFIAKKDGKVVAYVMSASWQFWSVWPMFSYMIEDLCNLEYLGKTLNIDNSYQYGPVCIDKSVRRSGLLEEIVNFSIEHMSKRYPFVVTFINKINTRSHAAHVKKLGFEVINEFEYDSNHYYELACSTRK